MVFYIIRYKRLLIVTTGRKLVKENIVICGFIVNLVIYPEFIKPSIYLSVFLVP